MGNRKANYINQQNPPRPKKARVDSKGNDWRKFGAKNKDGTTMPLIDGLTKPECDILENVIRETVESFKNKSKILVNFVNW